MIARLGMGAPSPQSGPPSHWRRSLYGTPPAWMVPHSGSTSQPRGHLYPIDSDRLPPERPGSQSDAVAARRYEAGAGRRKFRDYAGYPRGQLPYTDDPARTPPFPKLPDSTPKAYRLGPETTTLRRLLPVDALGLRPNAWNNDSEGCRTQATRHLRTVLLPGDGPAREVPSWIRH